MQIGKNYINLDLYFFITFILYMYVFVRLHCYDRTSDIIDERLITSNSKHRNVMIIGDHV